MEPIVTTISERPEAFDTHVSHPGSPDRFRQVLMVMAVGRVVVGVLARIHPKSVFRIFGAGPSADPVLLYMMRVFGIRAVVSGAGYLTAGPPERRRWQRLAFACDLSDTIAGGADLLRGVAPRQFAVRATVLTGIYAALGGTAILRQT